MSIAIMSWVFYEERQTKGEERLVLLALADQANDEGYTWPGQARLARKTNIDKSSMPQIQRRLIERRLLTIIPRTDPETGRSMSNLYRIVWTEEIRLDEEKAGHLGRIIEGPPNGGRRVAGDNPGLNGGEGGPSQPGRVAGDNPEGGRGQPESLINPLMNHQEEKETSIRILRTLCEDQAWHPVTTRMILDSVDPGFDGHTLTLSLRADPDPDIRRRVYGLGAVTNQLRMACIRLGLGTINDLNILVKEIGGV